MNDLVLDEYYLEAVAKGNAMLGESDRNWLLAETDHITEGNFEQSGTDADVAKQYLQALRDWFADYAD